MPEENRRPHIMILGKRHNVAVNRNQEMEIVQRTRKEGFPRTQANANQILTEIKRFMFTGVGVNDSIHSNQNGDIFEECLWKPNSYINISKQQRIKEEGLTTHMSNTIPYFKVNNHRTLRWGGTNEYYNTELLEPIAAKDSEQLKLFAKKITKKLTSQEKKLALYTENVTNLKGILGIEEVNQ
jgi:hypothetical protein